MVQLDGWRRCDLFMLRLLRTGHIINMGSKLCLSVDHASPSLQLHGIIREEASGDDQVSDGE